MFSAFRMTLRQWKDLLTSRRPCEPKRHAKPTRREAVQYIGLLPDGRGAKVEALTRSEARARLKQTLKIRGRLPVGTEIHGLAKKAAVA